MIKIPARVSKRAMQKMEEFAKVAETLRGPPMPKWAYGPAKKERRRKNARIRRYAKKHGLTLHYYAEEWDFLPIGTTGNRVAMPAGYFAVVDGVLHQLVAE